MNEIVNWWTSACQTGRYAVTEEGRRHRFNAWTRACTLRTSKRGTGPEDRGNVVTLGESQPNMKDDMKDQYTLASRDCTKTRTHTSVSRPQVRQVGDRTTHDRESAIDWRLIQEARREILGCRPCIVQGRCSRRVSVVR